MATYYRVECIFWPPGTIGVPNVDIEPLGSVTVNVPTRADSEGDRVMQVAMTQAAFEGWLPFGGASAYRVVTPKFCGRRRWRAMQRDWAAWVLGNVGQTI